MTVVALQTPQTLKVSYGNNDHLIRIDDELEMSSTVAELKVKIAEALAIPPRPWSSPVSAAQSPPHREGQTSLM